MGGVVRRIATEMGGLRMRRVVSEEIPPFPQTIAGPLRQEASSLAACQLVLGATRAVARTWRLTCWKYFK